MGRTCQWHLIQTLQRGPACFLLLSTAQQHQVALCIFCTRSIQFGVGRIFFLPCSATTALYPFFRPSSLILSFIELPLPSPSFLQHCLIVVFAKKNLLFMCQRWVFMAEAVALSCFSPCTLTNAVTHAQPVKLCCRVHCLEMLLLLCALTFSGSQRFLCGFTAGIFSQANAQLKNKVAVPLSAAARTYTHTTLLLHIDSSRGHSKLMNNMKCSEQSGKESESQSRIDRCTQVPPPSRMQLTAPCPSTSLAP